MTRKEAREQAFVLIFENCFRKETAEELLETAAEYEGYVEDAYCTEAVKAVCENTAVIDGIIGQYAKGWKPERISRVAVSAMRLAIAEMLYFDDIPEAASINEAVELVKKYATKEDASFVNGILGTYSRSQKED